MGSEPGSLDPGLRASPQAVPLLTLFPLPHTKFHRMCSFIKHEKRLFTLFLHFHLKDSALSKLSEQAHTVGVISSLLHLLRSPRTTEPSRKGLGSPQTSLPHLTLRWQAKPSVHSLHPAKVKHTPSLDCPGGHSGAATKNPPSNIGRQITAIRIETKPYSALQKIRQIIKR